MPKIELLLPAGAIAFYVYDAMQLLYGNELLFERAGKRWSSVSAAGLYLAGRSVHVPNLLTPHRPLIRSCWPANSAAGSAPLAEASMDSFLAALKPLQVLVLFMLVLLLIALPLVSWLYGAGLQMLVVFAVYYAVLFGAACVVYLRRDALDVRGRACGALLFDVCACAPFGVNLVRKLTLRRALGGDALQFAREHLEPQPLQDLLERVEKQERDT